VREGGKRGSGPCGPEGLGRGGDGGLGSRGRLDRFVCLFVFFFKPIFKPISNLFKFKSFTCFQIQILTQISLTILKACHKPFLTTFQTYFKFKPLHKIFTIFFTIIVKDFFTNILRLLKPHHSQNSCIQIMMHKHLLLLNY
jgi:hypothetical protein